MIILLDNVCKEIDVKYYTSVTSMQRENIVMDNAVGWLRLR